QRQPGGDVHLYRMLRKYATETLQRGVDEIVDVVPVKIRPQVARFEPRKVEQIAHEPIQAQCGFVELLCESFLRWGECATIAQPADGAGDRGQRRAQFVRD